MATNKVSRSQTTGGKQAGNAAQGSRARNKDHLKSDRTSMMGGNPAAQRDQFGTTHNKDAMGRQQKSRRNSIAGEPNLELRESAQDIPPQRGERNRQPGRRGRNSGKLGKS